ncbi:MAG: HEAT repeat domain-containing protein [Nitrospinae bacterium]|nr:HEAT repeat domain-containing protein [Nitrospinota bacterium]
MFEGFKISRLISQLTEVGKDHAETLKSLREYGEDGLKALVDAFKANKILFADLDKYLASLYDKEMLDGYITLLGDSKEQLRTRAREIIQQKTGPGAVARLVERLKDADATCRRGIAELLRALASPSVAEKLIPYLSEEDKDLKSVSMGLIADVGGAKASAFLLPLLKSPDWWVRKKAVEAICRIKDPASIDALVDLLSLEKDPKIKITVIQTLGQVGNVRAARVILPSITDNDMIVRQAVVEALENIADETIVPEIINFMRDAEVNVRRAGVEILSKLKNVKGSETLIRCIQDADWWVREIATDALAVMNVPGVAARVIELFATPDENVRRAAIEYFVRVPDKAAFEPLLGMLNDKDWWVREKAVVALGKMKDERAIEHILPLADDHDVRWTVPAALGEIGGEKAISYLADFLDDPERTVRLEALKALGRAQEKATLPLIKACVKDSDAEMRDTALDIIKQMTGHAVKANQIIAEQERSKWTGGSTIFTSPLVGNVKVLKEAILVLDLANSTDIGSKYGDDFAFKLTNRLVELTKPIASKYRVKFTKSTGDGYLMTFNEVKNAVNFAKEILLTMRRTNETLPPQERIDIRIAINQGETRVDDKGDRLGTAVNMTFRVEGVKAAGMKPADGGMKPEELPLVNRVVLTESVNTDITKEAGFVTRLIGFFELKGIQGQHRLFLMNTD